MKDERRARVAEEAAKLLYSNFVEDYKSAKEVACSNLKMKAFPSNFEVALELDQLSNRIEGETRRDLLINMRKDALQIMNKLEFLNSKLIGSVWRGTPRKGSDIDITVYSERIEAVVDQVKEYGEIRTEYQSKTVAGITKRYFHIYFRSPTGYGVEMVVRSPEEIGERRICETYGDYVIGLTRKQLNEVLEKDALRRFLPEREKSLKNK